MHIDQCFQTENLRFREFHSWIGTYRTMIFYATFTIFWMILTLHTNFSQLNADSYGHASNYKEICLRDSVDGIFSFTWIPSLDD